MQKTIQRNKPKESLANLLWTDSPIQFTQLNKDISMNSNLIPLNGLMMLQGNA